MLLDQLTKGEIELKEKSARFCARQLVGTPTNRQLIGTLGTAAHFNEYMQRWFDDICDRCKFTTPADWLDTVDTICSRIESMHYSVGELTSLSHQKAGTFLFICYFNICFTLF